MDDKIKKTIDFQIKENKLRFTGRTVRFPDGNSCTYDTSGRGRININLTSNEQLLNKPLAKIENENMLILDQTLFKKENEKYGNN